MNETLHFLKNRKKKQRNKWTICYISLEMEETTKKQMNNTSCFIKNGKNELSDENMMTEKEQLF